MNVRAATGRNLSALYVIRSRHRDLPRAAPESRVRGNSYARRMSWRLEALVDGRTLRAGCGEWLYPIRSEIQVSEPLTIAPWDDGVIDTQMEGGPEDLPGIADAGLVQLDYDLENGSVENLCELAATVIGAKEPADAIAEAVGTPPTRLLGDHRPPLLGEVEWIDLAVASVVVDGGWQWAVRRGFAFVGARWMVTVWVGFLTPEQMFDVPAPRWSVDGEGLPYGPEFIRAETLPAFREPLVPSDASDGRGLFIRLAENVMRHHEWALRVCQEGLVRWEIGFLSDHGSVAAIRSRMDELTEIGHGIATVNYGCRGVTGRVKFQPLFAGPARAVIRERADEGRREAAAARTELREGFALAAQAMVLAESEVNERRAAEVRRLEYSAAFVTAFVFAPSVIIGIYGANVEGLPGQNESVGLLYLSAAAVAAGAVTILVILLLMRRARRPPAA